MHDEGLNAVAGGVLISNEDEKERTAKVRVDEEQTLVAGEGAALSHGAGHGHNGMARLIEGADCIGVRHDVDFVAERSQGPRHLGGVTPVVKGHESPLAR